MNRLIVLCSLALVAAAAFTSCSGGATTKPTIATAAPTATSEPPVIGPLVVYSYNARRYVGLYDVGAGREVRHADTLEQLGYVSLNRDEAQWTGGSPRVVPQVSAPIAIATPPALSSLTVYSADLRKGVFVTQATNAPNAPSVLKVFDVESGATLLELPFSNPYSDGQAGRPYFRGIPVPVMWRDDASGFIVLGNAAIDGPTGWATVLLDGTVHIFKATLPLLSPTGRAAAITDGGFSLSCDFEAENHRVRIRDLAPEVNRATVTSERSIVPSEWSPDGSQLLYASYSTRPASQDGCSIERDAASAQWFLLPLRGGDPISIADVRALREKWHGSRLIERRCKGGSSPDIYKRCTDGALQLFIGGRFIATDREVTIVGFVDTVP